MMPNIFFFLKKFTFFYLFIYDCVESSFLCEGFLQLRRVGTTLHRGARASHCRGLSVAEHRLQTRKLSSCGSGLSCPVACGILPDQGSNPCPLHWQADSQPLRHQGSPVFWDFDWALFKSIDQFGKNKHHNNIVFSNSWIWCSSLLFRFCIQRLLLDLLDLCLVIWCENYTLFLIEKEIKRDQLIFSDTFVSENLGFNLIQLSLILYNFVVAAVLIIPRVQVCWGAMFPVFVLLEVLFITFNLWGILFARNWILGGSLINY